MGITGCISHRATGSLIAPDRSDQPSATRTTMAPPDWQVYGPRFPSLEQCGRRGIGICPASPRTQFCSLEQGLAGGRIWMGCSHVDRAPHCDGAFGAREAEREASPRRTCAVSKDQTGYVRRTDNGMEEARYRTQFSWLGARAATDAFSTGR